MLLALDLAGTFAFGLSGGLVGVRARLDLFGIIVVAGVVGLVGGITRGILLGALFLGETVGPLLLVGAALVVSGIYLVNRRGKEEKRAG